MARYSGYVSVPHDTYLAWKNATNGNGYDVDGYYGCQCLTAGHMMLMGDLTLKDIREVKVGDKLSTGNTVITNTPCFTDVYKVYTKTNILTVSKDHRFILDDNSECYVKDCVGKNLKINLDSRKDYNFTIEELKFLGFYLGDGTKYYRYKNSSVPEIFVTVGTSKKEEYLLKLGINFKVRLHSNQKAKIFGLINREHSELVKFIHQLDGKKLPLCFDAEQYEYIIDGYIHADGWKKRKQYVCSSIDKELLLSIQHGCFLNNWQAKLSEKCCRKKTNLCDSPKPIYRLSINKSREPYAKVIKIEYVGKEPVYVLNTDGDHLYYADNIKHHNCWDLASLFWWNIGFPTYYPVLNGVDAYTMWERRNANATYNGVTYFDLIDNVQNIKQGDIIVFNCTSYNPAGHVGFADVDYASWTPDPSEPYEFPVLSENNGGTPDPDGGSYTNIHGYDIRLFLGAFRYKDWGTTPPTPSPSKPIVRRRFPWAIYSRKLREKR